MNFPDPLIKGTLVKRYKRFLSDIVLESGEEITVPRYGFRQPAIRIAS